MKPVDVLLIIVHFSSTSKRNATLKPFTTNPDRDIVLKKNEKKSIK